MGKKRKNAIVQENGEILAHQSNGFIKNASINQPSTSTNSTRPSSRSTTFNQSDDSFQIEDIQSKDSPFQSIIITSYQINWIYF